MNRKDYRQMMQTKKRNKMYAKTAILGALGLGVALTNSTVASASEWTPNTSTTIKQGDKQYTIKWGDYLELISKDSGLTIETLMKLNNILNADLIYAGNIIEFGDGANAVVKDSSGNVIASTPLTSADKQGIKQAEENKANRSTKTDSKKTNVVKVENNGNGTGVVTKPEEGKPKPPVKPDSKEVTMTVYYLQVASADKLEEGIVLKEETIKAKKGEKVTLKAKDFDNMNLISDSSITITAEENAEIIFDYVHKDARELVIRDIAEDGTILDEYIETDLDILVGKSVTFTAGSYPGYEVIGDKEKTIVIDADPSKNVLEFKYRKVEETKEYFEQPVFFIDVDNPEFLFEQVWLELEVLGNTEGVLHGQFKISDLELPAGFEPTGEQEDLQDVYSSQPSNQVFIKKVEDTKPVEPEVETIESVVSYIENGVTVSTEKLTVELDKDGKGIVTANVPPEYEVVGESTKTVTKANPNASFEVRPIKQENDEVNVTIKFVLVDENGDFVSELNSMTFPWIAGEELTHTADATWGDAKLISPATQTIIASEGAVMTFTYQQDFTPEKPQWVFGLGEIATDPSELAPDSGKLGNSGYTFMTHAEADNFGLQNVWAWSYENGLGESQSASWSVFTVRMKDGTERFTTHFNGY